MDEQTKEQLEAQEAVKKWLRDKFSFPRITNEKVNELVTGMASLLHAAATMVVKSDSKQAEGGKAIDAMQNALLYYIASQSYQREETPAEEQK